MRLFDTYTPDIVDKFLLLVPFLRGKLGKGPETSQEKWPTTRFQELLNVRKRGKSFKHSNNPSKLPLSIPPEISQYSFPEINKRERRKGAAN